MANTNLTPDIITDKALEILHQKLNFAGNIITDYDDSFAVEGAKIGSTLRIRQPIQYSTGTGATMATGAGADTTQSQTTLTVNSQRHVPMRFTSKELTMDIDDFAERHIKPAVSVLAAKIENDAFNMIDEVGQVISAGTKVTFDEVLAARVKLQNSLAPAEGRFAILDPQANADMVNDVKGLFHDGEQISKQYKEGLMGRTAGMDFYENTLIGGHTTGAEGGLGNYLVNGAAEVGSATNLVSSTLGIDTGTKTIAEGDVFTIANVYEVNPESKVSTGNLKQFTVLAAATGAGDITVSPAIIATGPYQNVDSVPADNAALTFAGAASTAYKQSLLFQRGFACFATADLVLPKGVDMAARRGYDGISMRLVRDYDVVKDRILTRLDVLYGYKILRPDLACKIWHT